MSGNPSIEPMQTRSSISTTCSAVTLWMDYTPSGTHEELLCQTTWFIYVPKLLFLHEERKRVGRLVFASSAQQEHQGLVGWMDSKLPNLKCWITGNFSKHCKGRGQRSETVLRTRGMKHTCDALGAPQTDS